MEPQKRKQGRKKKEANQRISASCKIFDDLHKKLKGILKGENTRKDTLELILNLNKWKN